MTSSVAPTPVMPKTAMAVASPPVGKCRAMPSARSSAETAPGVHRSTAAAHTVRMVKKLTLITASFSMRL